MASMFNDIARRYDQINRTGSLGLDACWRNRLIAMLQKENPTHVLDLACGTGALSWKMCNNLNVNVVGLDLSPEMLQMAKRKGTCNDQSTKQPVFVEGEAERLPFEDHHFDAITIAFGIRNFRDRAAALREAFRVLMPEGRLFILEFATPKNRVWRFLFGCYFYHILPLWGWALSGNKAAYRYLPQSVSRFPQYDAFCQELAGAGFTCVNYRAYTGGVAVLYTGTRKAA